jgi:hypothetical protein
MKAGLAFGTSVPKRLLLSAWQARASPGVMRPAWVVVPRVSSIAALQCHPRRDLDHELARVADGLSQLLRFVNRR